MDNLHTNIKVRVTTKNGKTYTLKCRGFRLYQKQENQSQDAIALIDYSEINIDSTRPNEYHYLSSPELGNFAVIRHNINQVNDLNLITGDQEKNSPPAEYFELKKVDF